MCREPAAGAYREQRRVGERARRTDVRATDHGDRARPSGQALATQSAKVEDVALTPSARMMAELTAGESFFDLALRMSATHKAYFLELYPPNEERLREFSQEAEGSLAAQQKIEISDRGTFAEFLARYFAD